MPPITDALKSELIKIFADKLAIGLIVLLAGLWINRNLERFKSGQALANEFAKQRVNKIDEVWGAVYLIEAKLRLLHHNVSHYENIAKNHVADTGKWLKESKHETKDFQGKIEEIRGQIGDKSMDESSRSLHGEKIEQLAHKGVVSNQNFEQQATEFERKNNELNSSFSTMQTTSVEISDLLDKYFDTLNRNRFWLGENIYAQCSQYGIKITDILSITDKGEMKKVGELEVELQKLRLDINNVQKKMR